jgi:hypothetical protein
MYFNIVFLNIGIYPVHPQPPPAGDTAISRLSYGLYSLIIQNILKLTRMPAGAFVLPI